MARFLYYFKMINWPFAAAILGITIFITFAWWCILNAVISIFTN